MTTEPKGLTDAEIAELRGLAVAVLADRLYVLGNEDRTCTNRELVERWNAAITPGLILQLTRAFAAGARSVPIAYPTEWAPIPKPFTEQRVREIVREELRSNDQPGEVAVSTSLQEKQNDDESNGRRSCGLAGEGGQTGTEHGWVDQQREGGSGIAEHDAGILCPQRTGNLGEGNAAGVMPLLFDNDWLRNRIEADPDDSELSAGTTTSPDPTPSDNLVRYLVAAADSTAWGGSGGPEERPVSRQKLREAAARITELEAENAKLRRVVEAAKEMRSCYMNVAPAEPPQSVLDFDATIKELDAP